MKKSITMASTRKTEMLQNFVSENPKIEKAELNGNQKDDAGRVVPPRARKEDGRGGRGASCPAPNVFVSCFSPVYLSEAFLFECSCVNN